MSQDQQKMEQESVDNRSSKANQISGKQRWQTPINTQSSEINRVQFNFSTKQSPFQLTLNDGKVNIKFQNNSNVKGQMSKTQVFDFMKAGNTARVMGSKFPSQYKTDGIYEGLEQQNLPKAVGNKHITIDANSEKALQLFQKSQNIKDATLQKQKRKSNFFKKLEEKQRNSTFNATMQDFSSSINGNQSLKNENNQLQQQDDVKTQDTQKIISIKENDMIKQKQIILIRGKESQKSKIFPSIKDNSIKQTFQDERQKIQSQEVLIRENTAETKKQNIMNKTGGFGIQGAGSFRSKAEKTSTLNTSKGGAKVSQNQFHQHEMATSRLGMNFQNIDINKELFEVQKFIENSEQMDSGELSNDHYFNTKDINQNIYNTGKTILQIHVNSHDQMGDFHQNIERITNEKDQLDSKLTLASKNYILQSKIFQQAAYNSKNIQGRISSTIADEMINDKVKNQKQNQGFKNSQTDREFNRQKLHQESNSLSQQQTGRSEHQLNLKVSTKVHPNNIGISKQSESEIINNDKQKKYYNLSKSPKNQFEMNNTMPISFQNQKGDSKYIHSANKIDIQFNKQKKMKKDTGSGGSAASRKLQSPTGTQNSSFDNKNKIDNIFSKIYSNKIFSGDQKLKKKKFDFNKNNSQSPNNLISQGYSADQNFYLQIEKHPEISIDFELQIQNKIQELKKKTKFKKLLIQQQLKNLKQKLDTNEEHLIQNKKLKDSYFKLFGTQPQFKNFQIDEQYQAPSDITDGNTQLENNSEEARTVIAEEGHDYQDSQNQNYMQERGLLQSQKTHVSNNVGIDIDSKKTGDGSETFKGNNMSGMNVTQIKDEHQASFSPTFMNASNIIPSLENLTSQKREIVNIIKIQPLEKIKEENSLDKSANKNNNFNQYQSSLKNSNLKQGQTPKFSENHAWIQELFMKNQESQKKNKSPISLSDQLKKEHQLFTFYNQTIGNSLFKEKMQTIKYVSQFQQQLSQDKEELISLKIQNQKMQKIVQRYQKFIRNFQDEWNENFKHKILRNNSMGSTIYDQSPAQNLMKGAFEIQPKSQRRSQLESPRSDNYLIPIHRIESETGHRNSNIRVSNLDVPIQGLQSPKNGKGNNSIVINQPDNFQFQLERKSALSNPATEKIQAFEKIDIEKLAKFLHQIKNTCKLEKALDLLCSLIDITKPFLNCSKIMIVPIDPLFQQIIVSKELNSKEKLQFVKPFEYMDNHIGLSRKLYGVSKSKQEMCSELIVDSVAKKDSNEILIKENKVAIVVCSEKRRTPFMILQVEVPLETKSNIGVQKSRHQSVQKSKDSHIHKQKRNKSGSPDLSDIQESRQRRSGSSEIQKSIRKQSAKGSTQILNKKKSQIKKSEVYIIHLLFQSVKLQIEKILYKQTVRNQKNAQEEAIELVQNFMNCSTLKGLMREMNKKVAPFFGFQNINVMFHDPEKLNLYTITFGDEEEQKQQFLFQLKNATSDRERENIMNKEAISDFVLTSNNIIQFPTSTGITAIVFKNQQVRLINDFTPRSDFSFINEIDNPKGIKVIENIMIGALKREDGSSNGIVQLYNSQNPITSYEKRRFNALSKFFGGCLEKMEDKTRKLTTVVSIQMNGQPSKQQSEQGYNWISEEGNYATFQKMSKSLKEAQQELKNQQQDLDDDFSDN